MTTRQFIISVLGLALLAGAASAQPADPQATPPNPVAELREFVDGALLVAPPALGQVAVELVAPELAPVRIELPPTVVPPEKLEAARLRASDLNGDAAVDQADLALLKQTFGACLPNAPCRGDLNGDGVVDDRDAALLMERYGQQAPPRESQRKLEVGYVVATDVDLLADQPLWALPDRRWGARMELHSPEAEGLRVEFSGFSGDKPFELRVYDPAGVAVLGPYTVGRPTIGGVWWSPTIFGDTIGLELVLPPGEPRRDKLPSITAVAHIYCGARCATGPGGTLDCHQEVACFPDWVDDGQAVGAISFMDGGSCWVCTGALLNRQPADFSPLFMTANHCINTQAAANTVEVRWLYQTATCGGAVPGFNTVPRTNGSLIAKRHVDADWSLLGLFEPPGANLYLGWDTGAWAVNSSATTIHHPSHSWKRITFGHLESSSSTRWNIRDTTATTEGGSSGSPVMDTSARVRGALCCGPDPACPPSDDAQSWYGRLNAAYDNLRYYLDNAYVPSPTVFVNLAVAGDPNNNGTSERGTAANPFNTVYEGSFCVRSGDEIQITPGSYNEQMTIWRPMTLNRSGTSGTVTIGL